MLDETLFGFLEDSIEVPDKFEKSLMKPNTHLSPYAYFSEFSPIFCTTEVPFDYIGEHMQNFAKQNNMSQKPRTLLVRGMKAEKFLLATPLLKWYLEHGLVVTEIFEVIEYGKMSCFTEFGEQVTAARRKRDLDSSQEIIATLFKLIGNSGYGATLTDQLRFLKVEYVKGFKEACYKVNDRRFKTITQLQDDIYESELHHSSITINIPIQIGNMILQNS